VGDQVAVRLLFNANLSPRLAVVLNDLFPGSTHVFSAGELLTSDLSIWEFGKRDGFTIVSKDRDFQRLSARLGAPPKVIWVRTGNCPTAEVERALRANQADIQRLIQDPDASFCVIDA
jgi:predicted nuclease of predicted toxin-antitoxin system